MTLTCTETVLDIESAWIEYKTVPTPELRNQLMKHYLRIVRYNAERINAKVPQEVDIDDLMSAGIFGLVDAIESFDLTRGVKFETYCAPRIRGAILDELRSMDWVPRLVRSRAQKLERATRALESQMGRLPTEQELAGHMRLPTEEFDRLLKDAKAVSVVSLSRKCYDNDSSRDVREVDVLKDQRGPDPFQEVEGRDLKELLTRGLSRAERLILVLYYYEGMTMKEIGMVLDLSESRVSQMHSAILERLRSELGQRRAWPAA